MKEKIIVEINNAKKFENRVNNWLDKGWRVKENTYVTGNTAASNGGNTMTCSIISMLAVVLYKTG